MAVEPGSDSGRVERWRESAAGWDQSLQASLGTVDQRDELKYRLNLGDDRRRLGAKLANGAPTVHLGSNRGQRAFGRAGTPRHRALRARRVLPLKAERGPDDWVELEKEEEGQNQAHTVQ